MSNQPQSANHRSLTGLVTKLVGDGATYGFINDEIFFPQTNVSGGPASVGDQVFAECEYSAHLPIKWNATSVKILNKAGSQQLNNPNQQQQSSEMLNQSHQQQQPYNSGNPVAVTYQQHRQQRQQRQMMDNQQPDNNVKPPSDLTAKLLEQQNNQSSEFFASNNANRSFPGQQQQQQQLQLDAGNIQPFQDQPMGPPNFTYTSQLGSAFVQNQFVPPPFLAQQQPMLPQQQQQQPPPTQHLLPQNQPMLNQNQRHNQHNKGMSGNAGGNRFNNQGDHKNERQTNRRNMNRNDNKFDRPKSGERDANIQGNNNRSSKHSGSRERSLGRGNKRDDIPARPSPAPHSSGRSNAGSDRGNKSKRHYEVQNIPKIQIMTNMNAYNMKQRCPSSIHVPSDLKDVIVNKHFRLDIKNIPKPLNYTIEQRPKDPVVSKETKNPEPASGEQAEKSEAESGGEAPEDQTNVSDKKPAEKGDLKTEQTPPSSKSDIKLNHKYVVKVILLSLPEMETIYKSVFGPNFESYSSDSKSRTRFDETISLLCNKGSNNGYSLIGGKFDPVLDGFIEGKTNEFERHGRQPDLLSTCKRVVIEQTGLDLGKCQSWTLLSTFMYNNKSDYFSPKASIEYSFIYMPQIWTMLSVDFDKKMMQPQESLVCLPDKDVPNSDDTKKEAEQTEDSAMDISQADDSMATSTAPIFTTTEDSSSAVEEQDTSVLVSGETLAPSTAPISYENLSDLKVTDLKLELDRRDIKYKNNAKKAELISMLQESLQPSQQQTDQQPPISSIDQPEAQEVKEEPMAEVKEEKEVDLPVTVGIKKEERQLEEGEVEAGHSDDSPEPEVEEESTGKRRADDAEIVNASNGKKICVGQDGKEKRVALIQESFVVRARDDQQQLSLVSLHEASQAARYDQFELSVASTILKESLVQHLSEYILTALVEDNKQKLSSSNVPPTTSSSQETISSDTNNNNAQKSSFKNSTSNTNSDSKVNLKELPLNRYINLAFSYFDSTHMGYVYFEDLNKLFNNTGLTISKRALLSLVGEDEQFNYKVLPDLSPKLSPTYLYEFPEQFSRLPSSGVCAVSSGEQNPSTGTTIEYKGVVYDVEKLVQQVRDAETLRVNLVERFNYAIENSDKQAEEIHVLEVSQKSLGKAIKAQNDEICDLKRERDSIKKKLESVRKGIKGTVTSLSDLIKEDK